MRDLSHLEPASRPIVQRTIPERLVYLQNAVNFPLKPLDELQEGLRQLASGTTQSLKPLTVLFAPSGMGTSSMLARLKDSLPSVLDATSQTHVQRFALGTLSENISIPDLCAELCKSVHFANHPFGTVPSTGPRTSEALHSVGVRMIAIDDLSALRGKPNDRRSQLFDFVRTAISRYGLHVVLNATPKTARIVAQDEQLLARANFIEILPFKSNSTEFLAFLEAYCRWCPLERQSDLLDDQSLRKALVQRSNGNTRNTLDILGRLAEYAILSGEERITYRLLRDYFDGVSYGDA
ncbi:TniB family NTP-binding protein [Aliiroseovarius sp. F20344]|uniref:TniB family NTP-binding protein n=1 Tax=Aliiroseovarius sp. F20344 TaxID=2926414 RepID=UPI001FF339F1|nr:TniB family NTP-binding protein [Aliiroseovarius sp. F20344]MCK0143635.1 TniB family NTP-binding protein [Aliiroseovarius sp. F20344]